MPLTAFLGRLFGQKRVYLASLALFVLSSALCGMARTLEQLVLFRVLQGFGAGALQPTEQAILRQTFPPEEQGMAMALFGMAVMIGPAVGPTLGGYIVDNFHWSWIFFINLPVGALGLFMVWRFVHEPEDVRAANAAGAAAQRRNMDWIGHRAARASASQRSSTSSRRGSRRTGSTRASSSRCAVVAVVALVALRLARARRAGPGGEPAAVQGPALPLGHRSSARRCSRCCSRACSSCRSSCRSCSGSPPCSRASRSCRARS